MSKSPLLIRSATWGKCSRFFNWKNAHSNGKSLYNSTVQQALCCGWNGWWFQCLATNVSAIVIWIISYLFIYLFSTIKITQALHYTIIVARGHQETTRLVRGGPLVTLILSNRSISTHNNEGYKTHYRYNKKSKTFVLNNCNIKIEVIEFGREFQIFGPWNKTVNCLVLVRQAWEGTCEEILVLWLWIWRLVTKDPKKAVAVIYDNIKT